MLSIWLTVILVSVSKYYSILAEVHVGTAINVFSRYGYLSISMRVIPRNDSDRSWIFREPTVEVFANMSNEENIKRSVNKNEAFKGDFHMEFCDNVIQLLQAYFRDFSVERLEKPWKAFTASWSKNIVARNLGISSSYVNNLHDNCFVLIRVARHREVATMSSIDRMTPDEIIVDDSVQKQIEDIKVGDSSSVVEFIRSFGSHYITSYVTGNALYQVFVYEPERYRIIKERLRKKGIDKIPSSELTEYFSPLNARHIGRILSASGNETVESWASRKLQMSFFPVPYPSLLKLHSNSKLLYELNGLLGNEALLRLDLKTLAPAFKDIRKRDWFHQVLDNHLRLWEVNM